MRAFKINAEHKCIDEIEISDLKSMQGVVGGHLEYVATLNIENNVSVVVYVNEDVGLKKTKYGFSLIYNKKGTPLEWMFIGNGLVSAVDINGGTVSVPNEMSIIDVATHIHRYFEYVNP